MNAITKVKLETVFKHESLCRFTHIKLIVHITVKVDQSIGRNHHNYTGYICVIIMCIVNASADTYKNNDTYKATFIYFIVSK